MADPFADDLDAIYDKGMFADEAIVNGVVVVGFFEEPYSDHFDIEGKSPRFVVRTPALTNGAPQGSTVTIGVKTFKVASNRPYSPSETLLLLKYISG